MYVPKDTRSPHRTEKDTQHCPPNSKQEANEAGEGSRKLTRETLTSTSAYEFGQRSNSTLEVIIRASALVHGAPLQLPPKATLSQAAAINGARSHQQLISSTHFIARFNKRL